MANTNSSIYFMNFYVNLSLLIMIFAYKDSIFL